MLEGRLAGKVTLVTGGAQGIGRAIACCAARERSRVGIIDFDAEGGADALRELESIGVEASFVAADVTSEEQVASACRRIAGELGAITVLVNNAGRNSYLDPVEMTSEQWDDVFAVDLKGAWLVSRAVLPGMIERREGSIVNIASIHARLTSAGYFPYAAAKSGLVGFTRSLALDMAQHQIRVNALSPGYVRTRLVQEYFDRTGDPEVERKVLEAHPLGRIGTPAEIAEIACFLASDAASYVTGSEWSADGGLGSRFAP